MKYFLYRSTYDETTSETGRHVHLLTCTAKQARPLIRVAGYNNNSSANR